MPIYDTVGGSTGGSGGGVGLAVTIDADGYTVIGDGATVLPFKITDVEIAPGIRRFTRMVRHPELGELELEITDVEV